MLCLEMHFPKFQVEGVAPTNHSSKKTRLNDLSYGIKNGTDLSSVLSQCTHLTDGQTDTFLIASSCWHSMQRGKKLILLSYLSYLFRLRLLPEDLLT